MKIIKVSPRGFCLGVVKSIKIARDTVKNYPNQSIYMLGYLVHNLHIINEMRNLGIIIIDDFKKTRLELLNTIPNNSIVLLSAHGSQEQLKILAQKKSITLIDTECEWVTATKNLIKSFIPTHNIIFIGKHFHPETNAIMSLDNDIHLITALDEINTAKIKINNNKPILVTNQTTLSQIDIAEIINKINIVFNNHEIIFKNDLCQATLERQNAVLNLNPQEVDLLLVVGDERSNNTAKLVELGKLKKITSYRISNKNDIQQEWLTNIKTIAITAGTSTPSLIQNEVINYLETLADIIENKK